MKTLANLLTVLATLALVFSLAASCCCIGGSTDHNGNTDIISPNGHNQGGGA